MRPLIIAAPASGCGKTTVTLGVLAALRRRGLRVAPFKVGPDFIDPGHHARAAGRVSRNLDGWMCGEAGVRRIFARGVRGTDLAVVEGVMGLFDGAAGASEEGSTAEIARWLRGRILLVVNAGAQARSAAALVQGFCRFDARLEFAGILFNQVAGPRHEELLRQAVCSVPGLPPVLGCLPRREDLQVPERHLGLVTAGENPGGPGYFDRLAEWVEAHADLDLLLAADRETLDVFDRTAPEPPPTPARGRGAPPVRIGVARDEAFCFYYPENLEALESAGAELAFFSPLEDRSLPEGVGGLYLGGGYPELYAERLASNKELLGQIRQVAAGGLPIYAECGGFMLLAESIEGAPMAGVFPAAARMLKGRKALGYREVTQSAATPLGPAATVMRGHEFHYSQMDLPPAIARCYRLARSGGEELEAEGCRVGNVLGSYIHLHFGSNPLVARNFVDFCRRVKGS